MKAKKTEQAEAVVEIAAEELEFMRNELQALRNARSEHEARRKKIGEMIRRRDRLAKDLKATKASIEALAEEIVTDTFAANLFSECDADEESDDDSWRAVPIDDLVKHGLTHGVVKLLRDAEIETIGQLADFQQDGSWIEKIPGIKSGKSEQLAEAMERFWADQRRGKEEDNSDGDEA